MSCPDRTAVVAKWEATESAITPRQTAELTSPDDSEVSASDSSHSRDDIPGRLTLTLREPPAHITCAVPIRVRCAVRVARQGRTVITELHGTVDSKTGSLQLHGELAPGGLHLLDTGQPSFGSILSDAPIASSSDATPDLVSLRRRFGLTAREFDVARVLALGESNAMVAATLGISPHTARRHTENVMLKLAAHTRAQVGAILRDVSVTPEPQRERRGSAGSTILTRRKDR